MIGTTTIKRIDLNPEGTKFLLQSPSPDWGRRKICLCDLRASAVKPGVKKGEYYSKSRMKSTSPREISLNLDGSGGPDDCRPPAVPRKACFLSCLRRRRGKGSGVSIQRHRMFGKKRVRKMGSGPGDQTGNDLRDRGIGN